MTNEEIYQALIDRGVTPEQAAEGVRRARDLMAPRVITGCVYAPGSRCREGDRCQFPSRCARSAP